MRQQSAPVQYYWLVIICVYASTWRQVVCVGHCLNAANMRCEPSQFRDAKPSRSRTVIAISLFYCTTNTTQPLSFDLEKRFHFIDNIILLSLKKRPTRHNATKPCPLPDSSLLSQRPDLCSSTGTSAHHTSSLQSTGCRRFDPVSDTSWVQTQKNDPEIAVRILFGRQRRRSYSGDSQQRRKVGRQIQVCWGGGPFPLDGFHQLVHSHQQLYRTLAQFHGRSSRTCLVSVSHARRHVFRWRCLLDHGDWVLGGNQQ